MTITTRYDVSSHLHYGGTSRKPSTEILITNTIIPSQVSSLPNDIVIDILSRLPAKPLMKFKSVCKHWLSLIQQDKRLIDLHFIRSKSRPSLLYINPMPGKGVTVRTSFRDMYSRSKSLRQSVLCGEIVESNGGEEQKIEEVTSKVRITNDEWFPYNLVLEPVNGLVCFIDWKAHAIKVYNASTREETPWIESSLLEEENEKLANKDGEVKIKCQRKQIYRFGFDPKKREHKVFCFWRLVARRQCDIPGSTDRPDYESWEALTVGHDTKWRRINAVPNENNQIIIQAALPLANCRTRQVYANGTIYWSNKEYYWNLSGDRYPEDPDVIVAFDVGNEKYRVIPIPDFILDEPRDVTLPIGMVALDGHVGLLYRLEPYIVKLWMLDDSDDKKLENCRGKKNNWSSETITLPFCCDHRTGVFAMAGSTNKILFECRGCSNDVSFRCLYSYDRMKKTFKTIEMDGISSFTLYSERSIVTTLTESLFRISASQQIKS